MQLAHLFKKFLSIFKRRKPPDKSQPASEHTNFFANSHHLIVNNPTMITQLIASGETVVQLLAHKGTPDAMHDSSARAYPPRCHPDTRKSLRNRIHEWVCDRNRHSRMFWILGPAAAGKSAIAQTVAEELEHSGRLGASYFFSRPNDQDDPDTVIPTLACQLATRHRHYKRVITQRLVEDPLILSKNRRAQFRELIIEPFQYLMSRRKADVKNPLMIIIDGLDECKGQQAQREFIELIGDHVRSMAKFPLLWMICSRPESHLKSLLANPDWPITCQREGLDLDDAEAQQDAVHILRGELDKIRRDNEDRLGINWPPEDSLRRIAVAASGHLGFASFIVKFIGDKHYNDPNGQLQVCLLFLGGWSRPGAINPLHALDLLYHRILSDIPPIDFKTTKRILGVCILYPHTHFSAQNLALFLGIDRDPFYRSLLQLHSVLFIPVASSAASTAIRFYHASFSDFLKDPNRSSNLTLNTAAIHHDVAIQSLRWQAPHKPTNFSWLESQRDSRMVLSTLSLVSSNIGWRACCLVSDEHIPSLISELNSFDFSSLRTEPTHFVDFLRWLYSLGPRNNSLIRLVDRHHSEANLPPPGPSIQLIGSSPEPIDPEASFLSIKHPSHRPGLVVGSFIKLVRGIPEYPLTFCLLVGKTKQVFIKLTIEDERTMLVRRNAWLRRGAATPMKALPAPFGAWYGID